MALTRGTGRGQPPEPADGERRRAPRRALVLFHPKDWLDTAFEIGIILKGLNGLVEVVGGFLLLFVTPAQIRQVITVVTRGELAEDPRDPVITLLLHSTAGLTAGTVGFAAVYLLLHGLIKLVLVAALLLNRLWAYPG